MKKIIVTLVMMLSMNTFAGEIVNRYTGESMRMDLDLSTNVIVVTGTSIGSPIAIKLSEIRDLGPNARAKYFSVTKAWMKSDFIDENYAFAYFPITAPIFVITIGSNIIDILSAPVQALTSASKNAAFRKDFKILIEAINSNETLSVSPKRYERISRLLRVLTFHSSRLTN